ncbi:MAG: NADH:flavin oxidoreductase [Acidobacteria bacterium]|nr:MAG: NADH:flavin oxidoreductase [Acidobacteriota bacterium]
MTKRYFHYQSLEQLEQEIRQLNLQIPLESNLERLQAYLGRPVKIGPFTAGNSMAIHPMEGCDGTPIGQPDELVFRRYERFARGGAKLLWFEATAVVPEGRANPRQLLINDFNAKSLEALLHRTRLAHQEVYGTTSDLVEVLQLTHSGRYSTPLPLLGQRHPVLDKVTFLDRKKGVTIPQDYPILSDGYLEQLEDRFVEAARLAREIGFKGVDIKLTHGYLGNELLGAKTRPGRYGGCLENRSRFVTNVLAKIRGTLGPEFLLASRLGVFDSVPYMLDTATQIGKPRAFPIPYPFGFGVNEKNPLEPDLNEPRQVIAMLRRLGVTLINISMGNPYANPHIGRPFEKPDEGNYFPPEHPLIGVDRHFRLCAELQKAFPDLVMVGTGYSWLQHFQLHAGAANIRDGRVTMMGIGRGALAYPNFARDALTKGTLDTSHTCKTLTFCTYLMRQKGHPLGQFPTGCPPFDKEVYGPLVKQARTHKS